MRNEIICDKQPLCLLLLNKTKVVLTWSLVPGPRGGGAQGHHQHQRHQHCQVPHPRSYQASGYKTVLDHLDQDMKSGSVFDPNSTFLPDTLNLDYT